MLKNGKLLGLINILDLLIVAAFVTAAIILAPSFIGGSTPVITAAASQNTTVYFTVELPHTTPEFAEKITVGDLIKDNTRGYYYGTAEKVEIAPATYYSDDLASGAIIESEMPGKVNVLLTVKCNGTENDKDITAEGQIIKIGKSLVIKGKGYAGAGYVVDIRTGEE